MEGMKYGVCRCVKLHECSCKQCLWLYNYRIVREEEVETDTELDSSLLLICLELLKFKTLIAGIIHVY